MLKGKEVFYEIDKGFKYVEEDVYEKGCLPETSQAGVVDISFKAATVEELRKELKDFYGVEDENIDLDACDEPGRIDVQVLEDVNGVTVGNDYDIEQWKQGRKRLFLATYTFNVKHVVESTCYLLEV